MEPSAHIDTFSRDHLPPVEQWPELLLEGNPDVAYPARLNCAVAMVDEVAGKAGADRVALRWREGQAHRAITYGELAALNTPNAQGLVDALGRKQNGRASWR